MASLSVLSTLCLCVAIIAFLYPQYSSAEDHITDGYAEIGKNQRFYRSVSTNVKLQNILITLVNHSTNFRFQLFGRRYRPGMRRRGIWKVIL